MENKANEGRRNFLQGVALTGSSVAVGCILINSSEAHVESVSSDSAEDPTYAGYKETEHNRAYYNSARF